MRLLWEILEVVSISDKKIKDGRLKWSGHVKSRQSIVPVRAVEPLIIKKKKKGVDVGLK